MVGTIQIQQHSKGILSIKGNSGELTMDLVTYYSKRAAEYESIYSKPERQADLRQLQELLRTDLAARDVLEIACGTGYWTERIALVADSITALDISDSVLEVARSKKIVNSK